MDRQPRYRAGHPPHDAINGLRVGGLAGGVIGILLVWIFSFAQFWMVLLLAAVGGAVGYFSQRRRSDL